MDDTPDPPRMPSRESLGYGNCVACSNEKFWDGWMDGASVAWKAGWRAGWRARGGQGCKGGKTDDVQGGSAGKGSKGKGKENILGDGREEGIWDEEGAFGEGG